MPFGPTTSALGRFAFAMSSAPPAPGAEGLSWQSGWDVPLAPHEADSKSLALPAPMKFLQYEMGSFTVVPVRLHPPSPRSIGRKHLSPLHSPKSRVTSARFSLEASRGPSSKLQLPRSSGPAGGAPASPAPASPPLGAALGAISLASAKHALASKQPEGPPDPNTASSLKSGRLSEST